MARILIVEDSKELQDITKMTLEFSGHEAITADNGKEALDAVAASGPFDLILSDIAMPVMDGLEFMRRFRAEHGGATPIVALTAESGDIAAKTREAGATGYIAKPFEPIQLLEAIGEYLA
jgi:CheY-like chemotaxis protein